jgi:cytochrome c-type biogenesis protein CcmH/NrfF
MPRAAVLTFLLILLGALGALTALPVFGLDPEARRLLVLWGLPAAAMLLSFALFPRLLRPAEVAPGKPGQRLLLLATCAVAFVVDQSFLAAYFVAHWATFGFSERAATDPPLGVTALWALPLCLVLGIWGWERALRGAVYTGWRRRLSAPAALAIAALTGAALALPVILPGGEAPGVAFLAATLLTVLCRELSFSLLFRNGGGLLVAGLYRGVLWFVEAFVVADRHSPFAPAWDYAASGPLFYAVRGACALLAAGVIAWVAQGAPVMSIERVRK